LGVILCRLTFCPDSCRPSRAMGRGNTSTESQIGLLVPTELPSIPLDGQVPKRHVLVLLRTLHRSITECKIRPYQISLQVLLPTAFARISLSHKSVCRSEFYTMACHAVVVCTCECGLTLLLFPLQLVLVAHPLQQQGSNVLTAVVPQLSAPCGQMVQAPASPRKGSASRQQHSPQTNHKQATAADLGELHALGTAASAGVTMAVALTSLFTGRPARGDTAITGELTLRGLVLPVGEIIEKLLAAQQAGEHFVLSQPSGCNMTSDQAQTFKSR
jgi:Lon protease (S16) C-terminal proteolytic domain